MMRTATPQRGDDRSGKQPAGRTLAGPIVAEHVLDDDHRAGEREEGKAGHQPEGTLAEKGETRRLGRHPFVKARDNAGRDEPDGRRIAENKRIAGKVGHESCPV
jgi:hypothetical protein